MRYVEARLIEYNRDLAYRIFSTDCLGHMVGASVRWIDKVHEFEKPVKKVEETPEQIVSRIKSGLMKIGE